MQGTVETDRPAFRIAAVIALIPAGNMAYSGVFGRGGLLAVSLSIVFALAAVLLWTGASAQGRSSGEEKVARVLCGATIVAVAGYVYVSSGATALLLLAVPAYWLSVPIVVISVVILAGIRMRASLTSSRSS